MVVVTSIFIAETRQSKPLTLEQLEIASAGEREENARELIVLFEGKNRVLPIE